MDGEGEGELRLVDDEVEVDRLRILRLRSLIVADLHPSHILFYMPRFHDIAGEIMKAERTSRADAASLFLDKLLERSGPPGWLSEFLDALQQAGFENLAKHLSIDDVKDDRIFRQLISLGKSSLLEVKPVEIMQRLVQENVISLGEMEEIERLAVDHGDRSGMIELLFRLPTHQRNWFSTFIVALRETGYEAQLRTLEPLLCPVSKSDGSIRHILNDTELENSDELANNPEILKKRPQDEASLADSTKDCDESKEYQESKEPSLKMNAPGEMIYSRDGRLSDVAKASVGKPVAAAACFPQSQFSNISKSVVQETPVKQFDRNELRGREANSVNRSLGSGVRETSPKTLDTSDDITTERTDEDRSDDGDLNLISEHFPNSSCAAQVSRVGFEDFAEVDSFVNDSCKRHERSAPEDDESVIEMESRTAESEEKELVPNEVFVSNIPSYLTKEEIVEHFGLIGDIQLNSRGNPKVRLYLDKETREPTGEAIVTYALDMYANAAVEIFNATEFEGNILNVEIRWRRIRDRSKESVPSPDRTLVPDLDEQQEEEDNILRSGAAGEIHEELQLRGYQEELAEKAKKGHNCVILAPTGSGKTHVAMEIIRNHVAQMAERERRPTVVFFVPTVALVEQQRKQFDRYLKGCRIIGLSGDQDAKLPLSELLPTSEIIVLTPQILENALKEGDIETMSVLSLLIFDECHHTNKSHPYNMIMSHYIDEKLGRNHPRKLPQVVGLTASVGVGKSKTMEQAVQCILRLCANLDAEQICTVKTHLEELTKHVNKPLEDIMEINGRKHDPFLDRINVIMGEIERRMKHSNPTKSAVEENREFLHLLHAPAERGGDRYTQWMSRLQKQVDALQDQSTRRFYVSCLKHLQIYNTALLINADCRTKDALDYIKKEFNPAMVNDLHHFYDETDIWLEGLFEGQRAYLEEVSRDPKYENPMLNWLKDLVCDEFDSVPDSRGIIFCKTREMTVALVNWMKDTDKLRRFNPHNLVGTNAPSNKAGMTQVKQVDVLEYFKTGDHKLIVATSVAEEGLDVQKCNLVIRYGHVTNQIARVQSRGRARADNAQYLVVAEKGRGAAEKEESNKIREKMMQKAIDIINGYSAAQKREAIHRYQREAQVEREMAKKGKEFSQLMKASRSSGDIYELRCLKCDNFTTYSSDIRKIEASHHVILDPEYRKRIKIRPHPAPKTFENFELTGKIFCKECHADWGIMGVYKKVSFPVVKVCSLIVIREDGDRKVYKKWKEVPFQVQAITPDDLQKMMDHHKSELGDGDQEDTSYDDEDDDDDDFWLMNDE